MKRKFNPLKTFAWLVIYAVVFIEISLVLDWLFGTSRVVTLLTAGVFLLIYFLYCMFFLAA